jgi:HEAT repeat protein
VKNRHHYLTTPLPDHLKTSQGYSSPGRRAFGSIHCPRMGKRLSRVAVILLQCPGRPFVHTNGILEDSAMRTPQSAIFAAVLAASAVSLVIADPPPDKAEKPVSPRSKAAEATPTTNQPIADLVAQLKNPDLSTRRQAAVQLAGLGARGGDAVPALITALKDDKEPAMRASAAEALGGIGITAKAAVPTLLTALKDGDANVRETAAEALGDIKDDAKTVVPALARLLGDADRDVRCAAAAALGAFGAAAQSAIPELKKALQDKHPFVREAVYDALLTIDTAARKAGS